MDQNKIRKEIMTKLTVPLWPTAGRALGLGRNSTFEGARKGEIATIAVGRRRPRKYRDQWTGKLSARFHIISNELPRLGDASAAIVGRFIMLVTTRSWLGKEDRQLEIDMQGELTGILNWSLAGLERHVVTNGSRFTHVEAGLEALGVMRDLASPVAAFVREECETGPDRSVAVDAIYTAYRTWCDENGHTKATKQTFGRNLRAAFPHVRIKRPREGDWRDNARVRAYEGLALKQDR